MLEYLMCEYLEEKKSFEEVFKEFNDWMAQEIKKELENSPKNLSSTDVGGRTND